jgi:Tfp pilus assembly protein PilF
MNKIKEPPQRELEILFQYFQNQDDHRGKELARSIIEEFPNHQLTWKILAAILTRTGRDSEGITAYQKAIELDPQDHEAYNNLGKAFQDSQRFK